MGRWPCMTVLLSFTPNVKPMWGASSQDACGLAASYEPSRLRQHEDVGWILALTCGNVDVWVLLVVRPMLLCIAGEPGSGRVR